jgi:hypothetical protein
MTDPEADDRKRRAAIVRALYSTCLVLVNIAFAALAGFLWAMAMRGLLNATDAAVFGFVTVSAVAGILVGVLLLVANARTAPPGALTVIAVWLAGVRLVLAFGGLAVIVLTGVFTAADWGSSGCYVATILAETAAAAALAWRTNLGTSRPVIRTPGG